MEVVYIERMKETPEGWRWVPEPITLNTAVDFHIDENDVIGAMSLTAVMLCQYGGYCGDLKAQLVRKEKDLELFSNQLSAAYRAQADELNKKLTETGLREKVVMDARYQEQQNDLHRTRADAIKMENWWKAMIEKSKLLQSASFLRGHELNRGL